MKILTFLTWPSSIWIKVSLVNISKVPISTGLNFPISYGPSLCSKWHKWQTTARFQHRVRSSLYIEPGKIFGAQATFSIQIPPEHKWQDHGNSLFLSWVTQKENKVLYNFSALSSHLCLQLFLIFNLSTPEVIKIITYKTGSMFFLDFLLITCGLTIDNFIVY